MIKKQTSALKRSDQLNLIKIVDILSHPIPSLVSLANNKSSISSINLFVYLLDLKSDFTISIKP